MFPSPRLIVRRPDASGATTSGAQPRSRGRFQQTPFPDRRGMGRASGQGTSRSERVALPLTQRRLETLIKDREAEALVVALSTESGWVLLLESDFCMTELKLIFTALRKCCTALTLELLRRLMSASLVDSSKFVNRCCLLFESIGLFDVKFVEDVVCVLETSAWLQPAGLAKRCMVLICSLESHPSMVSWNDASEWDLPAKLRATREQFTKAANTITAARVKSQGPRIYKGYRTSGEASNSFRDMSIFPTQEDLEEEHPFLRPNMVKGAYQSLDDYLDVQFRLLREDYVTPLREGLRNFKDLGSEFCYWKLRNIQDVRFYGGVRYERPNVSDPRAEFKERIILVLAEQDYKHVKWDRSKRFTNGALIGISPNKFEKIIFATVCSRDPEALARHGCLTLELCFEQDLHEFRPGVDFSLIESSGAYFEAYRHNLAVIQTMTEMPFNRNLVFAERDILPPLLMTRLASVDLAPIMRDPKPIKARYPLHAWPPREDTILNDRQFEAVRSAFRNELCLIQGPPGTGKTYVGLKIVELMLLNSVTVKPFLIVCYTNHALDQFLEGISKFTQGIVRMGGRCNSENLEPFTMRNLRRTFMDHRRPTRNFGANEEKDRLQRLMWQLRDKRNQLTDCLGRTEEFLAELQGRAVFRNFDDLGVDWKSELQVSEIHKTLSPEEDDEAEEDLDDDGALSDEDRGEIEQEEEKVEIQCSSRQETAIKTLLGSHKRTHVSDQFDPLLYIKYKLEKRRSWEEHVSLMKLAEEERREHRRYHPSSFVMPPEPPTLTFEEHWKLYKELHWKEAARRAENYVKICEGNTADAWSEFVTREKLEELRELEGWSPQATDYIGLAIRCLNFHLTELRTELLQCQNEYNEVESLVDFEVIRSVKIIGVTTTGAAKFNMLLKRVNYEIVVVEEAAEVLEAHLITTLSPSTKQLILIGDHQQLQPSATVYKLATSFNLQISLFERLINNDIPYVRLQEQHRMRNEFLKLLVPTIYADYFSHKSVSKYENVKGLSQNLFFVTHENSENCERENSSKSNLFEADFVTRLALYLRMQGYDPDQIVILTTYSGQVFAIRKCIQEIEAKRRWTGMKTFVDQMGRKSRIPVFPDLEESMFNGIRITTVDNYQGEESDIVIASFVRSNDDQRIGFLSKDNRVCVALSRAKKGFYCIGNIAMLAKASKTWENISRVLLEGTSVNKGLELYCKLHDFRLLATKAKDFDHFEEGGCSQPCGVRLECGHTCPKTCHKLDPQHLEYKCHRDCERPRICGHACVLRCHEACGNCLIKVQKTLLCGHKAIAECYRRSESIKCRTIVEKRLISCGHTANLACCEPTKDHKCQKPCQRLRSCGLHPCTNLCSAECGHCSEFVDVESPCGHTVRVQCRDSKSEKSLRNACDAKVELVLDCGHKNMVRCSDKTGGQLPSVRCEQPAAVVCSLGHTLTVQCPIARYQRVDEMCEVKTRISLMCGHEIWKLCKERRDLDLEVLSAECNELVTVTLSCGHEERVLCKHRGKKSSYPPCRSPVEETLDCGHKCTRLCNENPKCSELISVISICGHEVRVVCWRSTDEKFVRMSCTVKCEEVMRCGHRCTGNCSTCLGGEFHRTCRKMCKKTLFCGHDCPSSCHLQCKPCVVKETAVCSHGAKHIECLSLINEPCTKKPQHCSHKKCGAGSCTDCHCSCDYPCTKILPCGKFSGNRKKKSGGVNHRCAGLCSELCVCIICDERGISSAQVPKGVKGKNARFIKTPCNHVFEKTWLDTYMDNHKDYLSFPKCPKTGCGAQIRLMKRYHELLERIRLNLRGIYVRVFGDLDGMRARHQKFFNECQAYKKSQASQNMEELNAIIDKTWELSNTPSLLVLEYLRLLFLVIRDHSPGFDRWEKCRKTIIDLKECQSQFLWDCIVAVNKEKGAKGEKPIGGPTRPLEVDQWALCDKDHVFCTARASKCEVCHTGEQ